MKFNKLTVIKLADKKSPRGERYWDCKCDCGNVCVVKGVNLRNGNTTSCGCNKKGIHATHGKTNSKEYNIWDSMIGRCHRENRKDYHHYGGRGIFVCERWRKFKYFYEDMGDMPSNNHSLDRIDNNGPYSPENCRWATLEEQHNNTRVNNYITFRGETKTLTQWARERKMNEDTIRRRLRKGLPIEEVMRVKEINLFYYEGVGKTLSGWSKEVGIPYNILWVRLTYRGWSIEKALFTPVEPRKKRNENKKT